MGTLPESVLSIYIPNQGNVEQGKYCQINDRECFVANMTERKWFRNYGGYAISRRVLDKLPRGTSIIFKRTDLDQYYITNKNTFQKKGILVNYGGHSQWVLPLKNWIVKSGKLDNEPKDLPVTDLEKWGRKATATGLGIDGSQEGANPSSPTKKYYSFNDLANVFKEKYRESATTEVPQDRP